MIIWIASYPKSGNTWLRSLLSTYLYSKNGDFNFELLRQIDQFPSRKYFDFFLKDFKNLKNVSKYWIAAQDRINLFNQKTIFLKTHSALCTLENNPFTNRNNTKAAIYVVRDPRNLITSLSHHYSMTIDESYNFIINKDKIIMQSETDASFGTATLLGNWSEHYKSWKGLNFAPVLIVKYEDLIKDTKSTFRNIINFLSRIIDVNINENRINNVIESCSFERLEKKEKKEGFFEAVSSKKDNKMLKFFYLGKKNNWKNLLDPLVEKKTRSMFEKEMKELNYI
jgi:hypothetical protein